MVVRRTKIYGCRAGQQSDSVTDWIVKFTRWLLDMCRENRPRHSRLSVPECVFTCYPSCCMLLTMLQIGNVLLLLLLIPESWRKITIPFNPPLSAADQLWSVFFLVSPSHLCTLSQTQVRTPLLTPCSGEHPIYHNNNTNDRWSE